MVISRLGEGSIWYVGFHPRWFDQSYQPRLAYSLRDVAKDLQVHLRNNHSLLQCDTHKGHSGRAVRHVDGKTGRQRIYEEPRPTHSMSKR